jgi:hypothetical protein
MFTQEQWWEIKKIAKAAPTDSDMICRFPPLSSRRGERGGACGDRDPAASVVDYSVGYA